MVKHIVKGLFFDNSCYQRLITDIQFINDIADCLEIRGNLGRNYTLLVNRSASGVAAYLMTPFSKTKLVKCVCV